MPTEMVHATVAERYVAARQQLARQVHTLLDQKGAEPGCIVQASVALPPTSPLHWLMGQRSGHSLEHDSRIYWAGREDGTAVAGIGEADVVYGPPGASLHKLAGPLGPMLQRGPAGVRYYGGLRFDPSAEPEGKWRPFGAFWFVLPRFEVRTCAHQTTLCCNLVPARDYWVQESILAMIARIGMPDFTPQGPLAKPISRINRPDMAEWHAKIDWALGAFVEQAVAKVVLSREALYIFAEPLKPLVLLERLAGGAPHCFHFLFQPKGGAAFVGASPERLFERRGRAIASEAVAGTRPRGACPVEDARLLNELLHSDKERLEHEYVRISLREQLQPLAGTLHLDAEPSEMKLTNGRHLVSKVHAVLRPGVTSLDVLEALHPTPAVGGYPGRAALRAIRAQEPIDRGWYAGPVGWLGKNQADFCVGIRSGLIVGNELALYSGGGIVTGSEAQAEWQELEHKIQGFTRVLGIEQRGAMPEMACMASLAV